MKKAFLLFSSFLFIFLFSYSPNIAYAENEDKNSISLVRITLGQTNAFAYLFPVNTAEFEQMEIGSIEIEGFKYFLKSRISLLKDSYKTRADGIDGANVSDVKYYTEFDAVGFEITFDSMNAYNQFFDSGSDDSVNEGENESGNKKVQNGLFVSKTIYETSFPFGGSTVNIFNTLYDVTISSWADTFNVDVQKEDYINQIFDATSYVYEIISPRKTIYSDEMSESNGMYYNVFKKSQTEILENGKITFWTVKINYGWWYFFALLITICVTFILLLLDAKKRKKNLKNEN